MSNIASVSGRAGTPARVGDAVNRSRPIQHHSNTYAAIPPVGYNRRDLLTQITLAQLALAVPALWQTPPAHADAAETLQKQYDEYSETYDELDDGQLASALGFPALRQQLLAHAQGAVLEVAVGTGLNLPYYQPQQLTSLTAIDLSQGMLQQAQKSAAKLPSLVNIILLQQADVTKLPFESGSFDTIVDTFSLCVFPDPLAAITEMARVVKPGGSLLLLEHSRSDNGLLGWYQDLTAPAVAATGKGCVWNQDVMGYLRAAGLKTVKKESHLGGLIVAVQAQRL